MEKINTNNVKKRGRPKKFLEPTAPSGDPENNNESPLGAEQGINLDEPQGINEDFLKEFAARRGATGINSIDEQIEPTAFSDEQFQTYNDDYDFGSLYGDNPTAILGREKREFLTKISQFKKLFPSELKNFKIKKNASVKELQQYLDEMESIISTNSVEGFITNCILQSLKIIEGISARTENLDITGTADALSQNPQFNKLCKILMIKHKIFGAIPPEFQLGFIVATTALVMRSKNQQVAAGAKNINTPYEQETYNNVSSLGAEQDE